MSDELLQSNGEADRVSHLNASPDGDVIIRPAQRDDAVLLFDMLRRLAEGQGEEARFRLREETLIRDGFGEHPLFRALIAEKDGVAVGMAIFRETYSTWSGIRGLFISDMFVDEDQRGAGVGYALVRHVAQEAAKSGRQRLELNVRHANPARNFYDRMGFAHLDNLLNYRLSDKDFARLAKGGTDTT